MKVFRSLVAIALVAALSLGLFGCADKDTAAKVNGTKITVAELDAQVEQLKKSYPQMFTGSEGEQRLLEFRLRVLDNLINQVLLEEAAEDQGVEVSDDEINKQVADLKKGFADEEQFEAALKSAGVDSAGLADQIRDQLVTQRIIEKLSAKADRVTDADVKEYYEKNKARYSQKAAKKSSHILVRDEATAQQVLAKVQAGGDFAALAKQYSADAGSASKGGDLGWPTQPYLPEYEAALAKLSKGQTTTALVKSSEGYHIIRVTDERPAKQKTLAEATDEIKQAIAQERRANAYQDYLSQLRKDAKIEILDPALVEAGVKKPGDTPKATGKKSSSKTTTSTEESTGTKK